MDVKKKIIGELKHNIKDREVENRVLLAEIEELNVSVNERQHIHEAGSKCIFLTCGCCCTCYCIRHHITVVRNTCGEWLLDVELVWDRNQSFLVGK